MAEGAAFELLVREMTVTAMTASLRPSLSEFGIALATAVSDWRATTEALGAARARGETDLFLANASVYLDMAGHLVITWMWLKQALAADAALANGATGAGAEFYAGKLQACRYFFRWELPKGKTQGELLRSLDATCHEARETMF
jgi:butyryl-CoA dehydrogenase